jgi:hypothetical protein
VKKPAPADESFFTQGETFAGTPADEAFQKPPRRWFMHWKWAAVILLVAVIGAALFFLGNTLPLPGFSNLG